MCVVLGVCGAAPVLRGRTARMFKPATHRARERDRHAAITGPVKCRRVASQRPRKRSRRNDTNDNAGHYQRGAAFARRERVTRWSLASVDRRSPLHPANSIRPQYMHLPRLRIPCDHWSASRPLESTGRAMGLTDAELNTDENLAAMCSPCNSGVGRETLPLNIFSRVLPASSSRKSTAVVTVVPPLPVPSKP
jgi:hypothetical protein